MKAGEQNNRMNIRPVKKSKKKRAVFFLLVALISLPALIHAWWPSEARMASRRYSYTSIPQAYSFINYSKNELQFPGGNEKWDELFARFERLIFDGDGKINILHIGGSHVQGGALTDKLRSNFAELTYGVEGERGFVFPYQLAGTNAPKSMKCTYTGKWQGQRSSVSSHSARWGMSGIAATTNDSVASFQLSLLKSDSLAYPFNKVRVYFSATSNMQVELVSSVKVLEEKVDTLAGFKEWIFSPSMDQLDVSIHRTDSLPGSFTLQGVYLGDNNNGITYNTIGVNGAGTYSYLKCPDFKNQIATLKTDVVVFAIGVNDANCPKSDFDRLAFEARYDSLITQFKAANPKTCFLFITNNDTYYDRRYPNPNGPQVQLAMMNLAQRHQGAIFDFFEIMGGLGAIDYWVDANLAAKDRIHFTKTGYEYEADLMYAAFQKSFGDYLARR
jgi:lysophospholipase L1-like esterase